MPSHYGHKVDTLQTLAPYLIQGLRLRRRNLKRADRKARILNRPAMYRNPRILASANGQFCTVRSPHCRNDNTVVWAHSNYLEDGKGKGIKAHDIFGCYACEACHRWLDQSGDSKEMKRDVFHRAMKRSLLRLLEAGIIK